MILVEEQTRIASSEVITEHSARSVVEKLDIDASPPPGLIAHSAGWDEKAGVFRIVGFWTSADALESFMRDRLAPVLADTPGSRTFPREYPPLSLVLSARRRGAP
jgi:hypothetical protein